jgi:hypothetical protein
MPRRFHADYISLAAESFLSHIFIAEILKSYAISIADDTDYRSLAPPL